MLALCSPCRRPLLVRPLSASQRLLTTHPTFQLLNWFSLVPSATFLEQGLLFAHGIGGSWALDLVACTAVTRILVSTATMTYQRRFFTKYAVIMHPQRREEKRFREAMSKEVAASNAPPAMLKDMRAKELLRLRAKNQEIIEKYNIHPLKGFVVIGLEMFFWLSYAVALRNIVAGFPDAVAEAGRIDMQTQGLLWFKDLTAVDPYCLLPAIASITIIVSVHMMAQWRAQNGIPEIRIQQFLRVAVWPLSAWVFYCLSNWPSAIALYMTTSAIVGTAQSYAFTHPAVQRALRIPQFAGRVYKPVSLKLWLQDISIRDRKVRM